MKQFSSLHCNMDSRYVAAMVTPTRIYKGRKPVPFLKEHRKAKDVTAEAMAGRLGIERESVHRLERVPGKITVEKLNAYAAALEMEPEDLMHPPGQRSLDAIVKDSEPEVQAMVADIVLRMIAGRR